MFAPAQNMRSRSDVTTSARTSRVREAQALDRVGELDVDPEIVGVELERIAGNQSALFADVHRQRRDLALDVELPVTVAGWIGLEANP